MATEKQILTEEQVLSVAKKIWDLDFKLINYKIGPFSNERLGFMSLHKSLNMEIEEMKSKTKRSTSVFLKCLPSKDDPLAVYMTDMGVFDREIAFYRDIVPSLRLNFNEDPWCPMSYGITDNVIILEDMRNKHFSLAPSKVFSYDEMKYLLSAIARMQSASILAEHRLGKPLDEVYPEAFNMEPLLKPNSYFRKWYQTGINLGIRLAKKLGLNASNIQSTGDKLFESLMSAKGKQNVVTHSDLWSNNIMFNGESKCVLLDFQWTRYCPPAQDVILVLHYCNDKEFRAKHMDDLLKYYYEEMTRILQKHNVKVFSWEEFMGTIKEQTVVAKILMVLCFPSIFMDGNDCAEMMNDSNRFTEFMYYDKAPVTMSLLNRGGEYEAKVTQAVIELVEISETLK